MCFVRFLAYTSIALNRQPQSTGGRVSIVSESHWLVEQMFGQTDGQTDWKWDFWGTFQYIQASERKPRGSLIWLSEAKKGSCSHCEVLRPVFLRQRDEVALSCSKVWEETDQKSLLTDAGGR